MKKEILNSIRPLFALKLPFILHTAIIIYTINKETINNNMGVMVIFDVFSEKSMIFDL